MPRLRPDTNLGSVERINRENNPSITWQGYVSMWGCDETGEDRRGPHKNAGFLDIPYGVCQRCGCFIKWDTKLRRAHYARCK